MPKKGSKKTEAPKEEKKVEEKKKKDTAVNVNRGGSVVVKGAYKGPYE